MKMEKIADVVFNDKDKIRDVIKWIIAVLSALLTGIGATSCLTYVESFGL